MPDTSSISQSPPGTTGTSSVLAAKNLGKVFRRDKGEPTRAIGDVTFTQAEGQIVSIVGPSGCGKTTLLRCLAGLITPDFGTVEVEGKPVRGVTPGLSVVFQEYNRSLFPWLTLEGNVRFPLKSLGRAEAAKRVERALREVGLTDAASHYPWQVSGGMQQRAAIARAIATEPRVLLMDEPFASVDAQTRISLEQLTMAISTELGLSTLIITHDIDEAIIMSHRVVVLSTRPSRVLREIDVDLPWPRADISTKGLPRFLELRREVHDVMFGGAGEDPDR